MSLTCKEKCFKYLKYSRTEYEVRKYLKDEGELNSSIEEAIKYAKKLGYIDDEDYALMYINDHIKINGWGPIKIKYKLAEKGISGDLVDFALQNNEKLIMQNLENLIIKKSSTYKLKDYNQKKKLMNYLYNKGYPFDLSKALVERHWK